MQCRAQQRDIAEFRIANHRGQLEAGGAHLPQQGEHVAPFLLKANRRWDPRLLAALGGQPRVGQIQGRPQKPRAHAGPQRDGGGDLAIRDLAQRAAVLPRHPDRVRPLFRKARAIENQDPAPFRNDGAQPAPDPLGIPWCVRDEMLKGLVRDRLGHARQHRLHRLPLAVAEDALDVAAQRQQLRAMAKAAFELLQPSDQSLNARRGRVVDHRVARYQTIGKSTMSSIQITHETRTNQWI